MIDISSDGRRRMRLIIVEDELLVAETMREDLVDAGFDVVGLADRLEKAMTLVSHVGFDVAIVDLNLAGVSALPVVKQLAQLRQPFLILSGYSREQLDEALSDVVILRKPYHLGQLIANLKALATKRSDN